MCTTVSIDMQCWLEVVEAPHFGNKETRRNHQRKSKHRKKTQRNISKPGEAGPCTLISLAHPCTLFPQVSRMRRKFVANVRENRKILKAPFLICLCAWNLSSCSIWSNRQSLSKHQTKSNNVIRRRPKMSCRITAPALLFTRLLQKARNIDMAILSCNKQQQCSTICCRRRLAIVRSSKRATSTWPF